MEDKILNVIVSIERVKLAAKDLHYRSFGQSFYALHLLADKIDFGSAVDDLKEAYYLGTNKQIPFEFDIMAKVVGNSDSNQKSFNSNGNDTSVLIELLTDVIYCVEEAKREAGLLGGIHAILDSISQNALVFNGLLSQTNKI